ncbi:unnamed protein product, partial [Effrenium voratum]
MEEIRWRWKGDSFRKVLAADSYCQAVDKLRTLKRRHPGRAIRLEIQGTTSSNNKGAARKELPFESVEAGISYLQLKADEEAAAKRKLGSAAVPATALKALQCPDGHPITRRGEPAKFFQDKRTCHVCGTGIGSVSTFWRCTKNCKYNVCHQCLQSAAQDAGQAQLEVPRSEAPSESIESDVFALEHTVYFEGRGRLWAFSLQLDFGPQLAELRSCFQAPDAVLLRCDGEVEVISSLQQLQAPDLSALHLEEPQPLLARVLAEPNLR